MRLSQESLILRSLNDCIYSYEVRRWDSFDAVGKSSKIVKSLPDQSTLVDRFSMLDFLGNLSCPFEECFVKIVAEAENLNIPTDHHIPVQFSKSEPFNYRPEQKITFDQKSCQRNETALSFDVLAVHPEPFVWFDIRFSGGDFVENLIWITEPRTTVTLELNDISGKSS